MAVNIPLTIVFEFKSLIFVQATILPPLPLCKASAEIFEPLSILKKVACNKLPDPCQSPPNKISPPPVLPSADIVAALISISFAVTSMFPPFSVSELEFNVPEISEAPLAPASISIFFAFIVPEFVTSLTTPFSVTKPFALAFSVLITSSTTD